MKKKIINVSIIFILLLIPVNCSKFNDLNLTLLFNDRHSLNEKDNVEYKGMDVGEINEIGFHDSKIALKISIYGKFKKQLNNKVIFIVWEPGLFSNVKESYIEIIDDDAGKLIRAGEIFNGKTQNEYYLQKGLSTFKGTFNIFNQHTEKFIDDVKNYIDSEEGQAFINELNGFSKELLNKGKEKLYEIKKDYLPEIKRKLEELDRYLREKGKYEEADKLAEDFKKLFELD